MTSLSRRPELGLSSLGYLRFCIAVCRVVGIARRALGAWPFAESSGPAGAARPSRPDQGPGPAAAADIRRRAWAPGPRRASARHGCQRPEPARAPGATGWTGRLRRARYMRRGSEPPALQAERANHRRALPAGPT